MDVLCVVGGRQVDAVHLAAAACGLGVGVVWSASSGSALQRVGWMSASAAVNDLRRFAPIAGVVAGDRESLPRAWQIAEALGMPRLRSSTAVRLAAGHLPVLERLALAGVRVPSWRVLSSSADLTETHGWEWALKVEGRRPGPVALPGRRQRMASVYAEVLQRAQGQPVYAQRWLAGVHHYLVTGVITGGLIVAAATCRREFYYGAPITAGFDVVEARPELVALLGRVAAACRWTWGPVTIEVVESGGGWAVVDAYPAAPELGVVMLLDTAAGQHWYSTALIEAAMAHQPAPGRPTLQPASLRYVVPVEDELARTILAFERKPARLPPGAVRWVEVGDVVSHPAARSSVWGYAIATGPQAQPAAEAAAAAVYASVIITAGDTTYDDDDDIRPL